MEIFNNTKYKLGQRVKKIRGSQWKGTIVGFYSTELTPMGYAVESDTEIGSVQIYPEKAIELIKNNNFFDEVEKEITKTLESFGCKHIRVNIVEFAVKNGDNSAYSLAVNWITSFGDSEKKRLIYYSLDDLKNYEVDLF